MLVVLFSCGIVGIVCFLIGKAVSFNRELRAAQAVANNPDAPPEAIVDMRSGEVLYPGTKSYDKAVKKSKVRFVIEE